MSRGLPEEFVASDKGYSLYEDVDYTEYWDDPGQLRQDALEKRLIAEMLPARGRRIVDVGCGYGRLAPLYLDRFDHVVLYDGSLSLLRKAREEVGDRALLVAGDVARLPFKTAAFDCLLTIRVLQHMHDLDGAVRGMRRVLARDGQFQFSYHNKRNAHRILHYWRSRRISDPFSLESAEVSPTLISHHPARMDGLLASCGFKPAEYRGAVVINAVAKLTERFRNADTPSGLGWATFTGTHRLAPWLVGRTFAADGDSLIGGDSTDAVLACPACDGDLSRSPGAYRCGPCAREYVITDGIVDFRL